MDPLSITASAVAVLQAAGFTATTIFNFVKSIRSADSRVSSLCDELSGLQTHLDAVQKTLEECRFRELAPVQPELWQRCDDALKDCLVTLSLLEVLVNKIKDTPSAKGKGLRWRARVAVDLSIHGDDLATFRDKIQKSNSALQTMLHTITLSLSLKSNASQDTILFELEQLKSSFKEALRLSSRPTGRLALRTGNADARLSLNLHKLAAAARQFHSAASSTSGTTRDGSNGSWPALSLFGDFPDHRRQRVKDFVEHQLHYPSLSSVVSGRQTPVRASSPSPTLSIVHGPIAITPAVVNAVNGLEPVQLESASDDDDDAEDEREYFDGLEELARDRILSRDYDKAIEFLKQAMTRDMGTSSTGNEFRELQTQLALCHFFQGGWEKAEPIVDKLGQVLDEVTCNLLHALALSYLSVYSLDKALKTCRKSMNGKKRLLNTSSEGCDGYPESDYAETVALFTMIHHMSGDPIRAEIYHRRLPDAFEYKHPASALDYIMQHPRMLRIVLGDDVPVSSSFHVGSTAPQLPRDKAAILCRKGTVTESPLRTRFAFFERYENDTSKHVVAGPCPVSTPVSPTDSGIDMDADDEISPIDTWSGRPLPREEHRNMASPPPVENTPHPSVSPNGSVTRNLSTRRPQRPAFDDDSGADATQSPSTDITPLTRWFKGGNKFAFTKSRTLLRRKTNDNALKSESSPHMVKRTRTLRLGTIELTLRKMSAPSQSQVMKDPDSGIFLADYDGEGIVTPSHTQLRTSAQPLHRSRSPNTGRLGQYVVVEPHNRPSNAAPRRHPGFSTQVSSHTCNASASSSELLTTFAVGQTTAPTMTPGLSVELPVTEKPLELHDRSLSPVDMINYYLNNKWESFRIRSPSGEASSSTAITPIEVVNMDMPSWSQWNVSSPLATTATSQLHDATDLAGLLGQAASVVASLPEATDISKRLASRSRLKAILRLLEDLSNDQVLVCDLRRIIASLDTGHGSCSSDDTNDSGYETGDQQHEKPRRSSSQPSPKEPLPSPGAVDLVQPGLSTPMTEGLGGSCSYACLRPTPSFNAGDDSIFTWREPEKPEESSWGGSQGSGPVAPDRQVLLALRPYAKPKGEGVATLSDLKRTFSFVAGDEDRASFCWERPEQSGKRGEDGGDKVEDNIGEREEAGTAFVSRKQVMWALSPEPLVASDSIGSGGSGVRTIRKSVGTMRGLAERFSPGIRNLFWQEQMD